MSSGGAPLRHWLCFVAIGAAGCAATAFDGRVYDNGELAFRLASVPAEWQPLEADGALLAFRDATMPASIVVNGRCGRDGEDVPLQGPRHHLFPEFSNRVIEKEGKVDLGGREALQTQRRANL